MEKLLAVARIEPIHPIYTLGEKLRKTGLLEDHEIDLILDLKYAENLAKVNPDVGTLDETTHTYRIKSALSAVYESQFLGQVMTPADYESPENYNDYSEREFAEILDKQEQLLLKLQPQVDAIVEIHEELANLHKRKDNK